MPGPSLEQRLWRDYRARPSLALRNELVNRHIELSRSIARSVQKTLPPGCGYFDDVLSSAFLGLIDAVEGFDPRQGNFDAYATKKIYGRIFDDLRSFERQGRNTMRIAVVRRDAEQAFHVEHGRTPSDDELRGMLGWTSEKVARSRQWAVCLSEVSVSVEDGEHAAPFSSTIPDQHNDEADRNRRELFDSITEGLKPWKKHFLRAYFLEGKTLRKIAQEEKCLETYVSRVIHQALQWLRQVKNPDELWKEARAAGIR